MMTASKRFDAYTERLVVALGHADRDTPFQQYTTGLLLPLARKSIEPIAARVDPGQVSATHQSLHHFVAKSDWSDRALLAASLPIDYQLYLPKDWAGDPARRAKAGVPEAIDFKTKPA